MWREENKLLPVTLTSAVDLDPELVSGIGERIEQQTGQRVELSSRVDPDVLGGIVLQVGNMVLDASVRNRLEQPEKERRQGRVEKGVSFPTCRSSQTRSRAS